MVRELTDKQQKFVDNLISGKTQYESYLDAYPNSKKWSRKVVDNKACELLKKENVKARYNELRAEEEARQREKYSLDRDKALESYLWLVNEAKETMEVCGIKQATANAYISALDKACNLLDLYPDKKQSVKLSGDLKTTNMNPFENLTEEELRKLIDDK